MENQAVIYSQAAHNTEVLTRLGLLPSDAPTFDCGQDDFDSSNLPTPPAIPEKGGKWHPVRFVKGPTVDLEELAQDEKAIAEQPHGWRIYRLVPNVRSAAPDLLDALDALAKAAFMATCEDDTGLHHLDGSLIDAAWKAIRKAKGKE